MCQKQETRPLTSLEVQLAFRQELKMHPFKMTVVLLHLMSISNNNQECVFFPTMSPARIVLCQGYDIVTFPTISESVASGLEEIYIVSTSIKCLNTDSQSLTNLVTFAEHDNQYWDCQCMYNWFEGITHEVDVETDCQMITEPELTTTNPPSLEVTSGDDNRPAEGGTSPEPTLNPSYDEPRAEDESPPSWVVAAATTGAIAAAAAAAAAGAAIIIAAKAARRAAVCGHGDGDRSRVWVRQSSSFRCCNCLKPNKRLIMPGISIELGGMEHLDNCESEL